MTETTPTSTKRKSKSRRRKIRYAVVGLGYIGQIAVLPAFQHARRNSVLAALVSSDQTKLKELSERYQVPHTFTDYDACLASGEVDAIFIALPNHLHCEYTVRAAEAGLHVLCEKPMAVTAAECEKMIHATDSAGVQLMIAYRLHLEEANLQAIELAHSGDLGDVRFFSSVFSINVQQGNVRLRQEYGGGTLYDIGVYCINASRYLFRDEPIEVTAISANSGDARFSEVDEMTGAVLRFPQDRLASFISSFGAFDCSSYQIVGTKGSLRLDPAYDYAERLTHYLTVDGKPQKKVFSKRDQFAAELTYFSDCVREGRKPEPDGQEGLADVKIIEALYESAKTGRKVTLELPPRTQRPALELNRQAPPVRAPELVHAASPQA